MPTTKLAQFRAIQQALIATGSVVSGGTAFTKTFTLEGLGEVATVQCWLELNKTGRFQIRVHVAQMSGICDATADKYLQMMGLAFEQAAAFVAGTEKFSLAPEEREAFRAEISAL